MGTAKLNEPSFLFQLSFQKQHIYYINTVHIFTNLEVTFSHFYQNAHTSCREKKSLDEAHDSN